MIFFSKLSYKRFLLNLRIMFWMNSGHILKGEGIIRYYFFKCLKGDDGAKAWWSEPGRQYPWGTMGKNAYIEFLKNLYKKFILTGHLFIFLKIILPLSLRFIGHLQKKKVQIGQFLSSLVFWNDVILGGDILSISKTKFPKLMFDLENSCHLHDNIIQIYMCWQIYSYKIWILVERASLGSFCYVLEFAPFYKPINSFSFPYSSWLYLLERFFTKFFVKLLYWGDTFSFF